MGGRYVHICFHWRLLCLCFFFFQIFCEENYMFYLKLEVQETEKSSLALFDLQGVSLIHCGSRCLAEHCCKEFMYHEGSMRCFGIQINDFDSTRNTNLIITGNEGLSTYRQGNLVYIFTCSFQRKFRYIVVTPVPLSVRLSEDLLYHLNSIYILCHRKIIF